MNNLNKAIERQEKMIALRKEDQSLSEIGAIFNLSGSRVRQILIKDYTPKLYTDLCLICNKKYTLKTGVNYRARKYCNVCSEHLNKFGGRERTREIVRIRDKHTCQKCGKKWDENMRRFDVHHKKDSKRNMGRKCDSIKSTLENMVTYCHKCHLNLPESIQGMKKPRRMSKYKLDQMIKMRRIGMSYSIIANALDLSYPIVRSNALKLGC